MSLADALSERVRLESPLRDDDDYGGAEASWELVGEYFAHVEARGARQANYGGQIEPQTLYRVSLRAPRNINSDMRLIWREHVLVIDSIVPQSRIIELSCHEERV